MQVWPQVLIHVIFWIEDDEEKSNTYGKGMHH